MTQRIPHELIRTIADGQCVLFVGSGLSRHTHSLATWGDFIQSVRVTLSSDHGITDDTEEQNVAAYPWNILSTRSSISAHKYPTGGPYSSVLAVQQRFRRRTV